MKLAIFLTAALAVAAFQLNAVTRFVTPTGAGAMNGTTWANAFPGTSLQAAIAASAVGDEVWVAAGTFKPTAGVVRTIYFSLKTGVAVYGSFVGNETALSQRNLTCGPSSILSAEIGAAGNADNSYHVISNTGVSGTAILDGFVVRDGNANFDNMGIDHRSLGGGMLNAGNENGGLASPTVRNCLFTNNSALFGGGMFNHGQNAGNANPTVLNSIFYDNHATSGGGGIDNFGYNGTASPTITNCLFVENTATSRAGGMYCWGGGGGNASPTILNCSFVKNSAVDGGGLVADRLNFAGGSSGNANPNVRNSIFWGNTASGTGPQFFLLGGATFTATYSDIDLTGQNAPHQISGPGTGNLNVNPQFVDDLNFDGPDNCWMTADDGLHLNAASPCIDAGNNPGVPTGDLKFYQRIANSTVDMGIYEENSVPLPIELAAFYGKAETGFNQLFWKTASEEGSFQFEIERSPDALLFEKIGSVAAAGNSQAVRFYHFTDEKLTSPAHFYRLKMVDFDGRAAFSPLIFLENENQSGRPIFQNPVNDRLDVFSENDFFDGDLFCLINAQGEVVRTISAVGNAFSLELDGLPDGIYFLKNAASAKAWKVVKMN